MGKRSDFEKISKDKYYTFDLRAGARLKSHIPADITYYEPCVGKGDLIKNLAPIVCVGSSDDELDARSHKYDTQADCFITNPPWSRDLLHPIIDNLRVQRPTWLLFDADWMHTLQAEPYLKYCQTILSVGRLLWIPGTTVTGKDNVAWYLFVDREVETVFYSRLPK